MTCAAISFHASSLLNQLPRMQRGAHAGPPSRPAIILGIVICIIMLFGQHTVPEGYILDSSPPTSLMLTIDESFVCLSIVM
jgi:hypothetical protein